MKMKTKLFMFAMIILSAACSKKKDDAVTPAVTVKNYNVEYTVSAIDTMSFDTFKLIYSTSGSATATVNNAVTGAKYYASIPAGTYIYASATANSATGKVRLTIKYDGVLLGTQDALPAPPFNAYAHVDGTLPK